MRREDAEDLFDAMTEAAIICALRVTVALFLFYGLLAVLGHWLTGWPEDPFLLAAVPAGIFGILGFFMEFRAAFFTRMVDPPEEPEEWT